MNKSFFIAPLMVIAGFAAGPSMASGPLTDAKPVPSLERDFFLCQSSHTGNPVTYSCRDYRVGNNIRRFYFNGGTIPMAVATIGSPGSQLQSLEKTNVAMNYPVQPPSGIPSGAQFMGSGVCIDDLDRNVPCGVFTHKPARFPKTMRYLVFYDANGRGVTRIDRQNAGPNPDAIPAELAYQIGLGLVESDCCRHDGLGYLKMALSLFPDSTEYRQAYERYLATPELFAER